MVLVLDRENSSRRALVRFQLSTGFSLAISPALIAAVAADGPAALCVSLTAATLLAAAAVVSRRVVTMISLKLVAPVVIAVAVGYGLLLGGRRHTIPVAQQRPVREKGIFKSPFRTVAWFHATQSCPRYWSG